MDPSSNCAISPSPFCGRIDQNPRLLLGLGHFDKDRPCHPLHQPLDTTRTKRYWRTACEKRGSKRRSKDFRQDSRRTAGVWEEDASGCPTQSCRATTARDRENAVVVVLVGGPPDGQPFGSQRVDEYQTPTRQRFAGRPLERRIGHRYKGNRRNEQEYKHDDEYYWNHNCHQRQYNHHHCNSKHTEIRHLALQATTTSFLGRLRPSPGPSLARPGRRQATRGGPTPRPAFLHGGIIDPARIWTQPEQ